MFDHTIGIKSVVIHVNLFVMLIHSQIDAQVIFVYTTPTHYQGVCHQWQSVIRSVCNVIAIKLFYLGIRPKKSCMFPVTLP